MRIIDNLQSYSGYIHLKRDRHFSYDLINGELTIHAHSAIPEIEDNNMIYVQCYDNRRCLLYSQMPVKISDCAIYPQNYKHKIDWMIENFEMGSTFTRAIFAFAELQYFCPSSQVVKHTSSEVTLIMDPKEIHSFDFSLGKNKCHVAFSVRSNGKYGPADSHMNTVSEIVIDFDETGDGIFLEKIYHVVDSAFAFICNRQNTTCTSMRLVGKFPGKGIKNGKIVDRISDCRSNMIFFDQYREEPEDEKAISKTFYAVYMLKHMQNLFQMIADDIATDKDEAANISISSIHPSFKRRRLIDLQQSLHITGAFEFYVRRYLPNMVDEKAHHTIIKMVLHEFAEKNTGKAKKLALSLEKNVVREPALEEKVKKAYLGYDEWKPLKPCIDSGWFNEDEIIDLAREANAWRNELAHEKRSYEPNLKTIRAIRLIEHLNYAIVLRELGYEDLEIHDFLENILAR